MIAFDFDENERSFFALLSSFGVTKVDRTISDWSIGSTNRRDSSVQPLCYLLFIFLLLSEAEAGRGANVVA